MEIAKEKKEAELEEERTKRRASFVKNVPVNNF